MLFVIVLRSIANFIINVLTEYLDFLDTGQFFEQLAIAASYLFDILAYVFYFLPVAALWPLLCLVFFVIVLKIVIAAIRFIINLVPLW